MRIFMPILATALACATFAPAMAKTTVETKYKVRFSGINVGRMTSAVTVDGNSYSITGQARTSGFAKLFSAMTANFSSYGGIYKTSPMPSKHALGYQGKKKRGSVNMGFSNGTVAQHASSPAVKYKPGSVPLKQADLRAAMDPISALVFPVSAGDAGKGSKVCNRRVPIFDGKNRFNLTFRYKRTERAKAKGFKGPVFVCSVRYTPVAGHRPNRRAIKAAQSNRKTEIGFARVGNTNAYTMFNFKAVTSRGTAKGWATLFKVK